MQVTHTSPITKKTLTRELPITIEELAAWESGVPIQFAMPKLPKEDREWLLSGLTLEDWKSIFGYGEEDNETQYFTKP